MSNIQASIEGGARKALPGHWTVGASQLTADRVFVNVDFHYSLPVYIDEKMDQECLEKRGRFAMLEILKKIMEDTLNVTR